MESFETSVRAAKHKEKYVQEKWVKKKGTWILYVAEARTVSSNYNSYHEL